MLYTFPRLRYPIPLYPHLSIDGLFEVFLYVLCSVVFNVQCPVTDGLVGRRGHTKPEAPWGDGRDTLIRSSHTQKYTNTDIYKGKDKYEAIKRRDSLGLPNCLLAYTMKHQFSITRFIINDHHQQNFNHQHRS